MEVYNSCTGVFTSELPRFALRSLWSDAETPRGLPDLWTWSSTPEMCQVHAGVCCYSTTLVKWTKRDQSMVIYMVAIYTHMVVSINGGTPSHHPFLDGIFPYEPTILGIPIYGNPHIYNDSAFRCFPKHGNHGTCAEVAPRFGRWLSAGRISLRFWNLDAEKIIIGIFGEYQLYISLFWTMKGLYCSKTKTWIGIL